MRINAENHKDMESINKKPPDIVSGDIPNNVSNNNEIPSSIPSDVPSVILNRDDLPKDISNVDSGRA